MSDSTVTATVVQPPPIPRTDVWSRKISVLGALFVTVMSFGLLAAGMGATFVWEDKQSFNNLMATIQNLTFVAAGFWLGSSLSAKQQTEVINAKLNQPTAVQLETKP